MPRAGSRRTATILDVARCAGVSAATVSRYLNGNGYVSDETSDRIAQAIAKLNYRPNQVARALVHERSQSLAVFSSETALYGAASFIKGIERRGTQAGYLVSIVSTDREDIAGSRRAAELIGAQAPTGALFISVDPAIEEAYRTLPAHMPKVLVGQPWRNGMPYVSICEEQGGYDATAHCCRSVTEPFTM